jgi:hypothetical protein
MTALRRWAAGCLVAFALASAAVRPVDAAFIQSLKTQAAIYIDINVLPAPIVRRPDPRALAYDGVHYDVVQTQKQKGIPVQANVIANPYGNLLTTSTNAIAYTQTAGTTVVYTCAYHVKVTSAINQWTLYTGLSNDFDVSFNGNTLSWVDYPGTPPSPPLTPTFQKFVVYPDNNNAWQSDRRGTQTYDECVDLTLAIPASVPGGSYSTNAIYSIYY